MKNIVKIKAITILLICGLFIIPAGSEAKTLQYIVDDPLEDNQYNCSLEILDPEVIGCNVVGWAKVTATNTSNGEKVGRLYYDYYGEKILLEEKSILTNSEAVGVWYPHSYWAHPESCGRDLQSLEAFVGSNCLSVWGLSWSYGSNGRPLTLSRKGGWPFYTLHSHRYNKDEDLYLAIYSFGYNTYNSFADGPSCPYGSCYIINGSSQYQQDAYVVFILGSDVKKIGLTTAARSFWEEKYVGRINNSYPLPGTEVTNEENRTGTLVVYAYINQVPDSDCVTYAYDEMSFEDYSFLGRKKIAANFKTGLSLQCDGNDCSDQINELCGELCEVSISVNPSSVWPSGTGGNTEADVAVSLDEPAPAGGCTVSLDVEPVEYSGGHSHNGNRPAGRISPSTVSFSEAEAGVKTVKYTGSEVAGREKIKAEINGTIHSEIMIDVKVPGLQSLSENGNYCLTGSSTTHPDNHYGTQYTLINTRLIAEAFYEQFEATLGINDMSLQWGGLFDIGPPYGSYWDTPHKSHKEGTSVDIDTNALSPNGWSRVDRIAIGEICKNHGGFLVREATIHCEIQ